MSLLIGDKKLILKYRPIAKIIGDEGKYLYISENDEGCESILLKDNCKFKLMHDVRDKRAFHCHIVGPSGVGKSTVCQEFCDSFKKFGKSVVISADEEEDDNLKDINMRLKADDELGNVKIEKLKNSLIVFDDIEGVPKEVEKSLNIFKRALHERGRKHEIKTLNVYHRGADGQNTKSSLSEMTHIVIFPKFANNQNTKYLLSKYGGLPENICDILKNDNWGRRVMIAINDCPQYMIGEKCASILDHSRIFSVCKYYKRLEEKKYVNQINK